MNSDPSSLHHRVKTEVGTAFRFAIVGATATLTHATAALALLETGTLSAFPANIAGFLVAFVVSFVGHHRWSFASTQQDGKAHQRMRRFFVLALIGFALNSSVLAGWLGLTSWPQSLGILFSIAVVPALTFFGARLWAFSGSPPASDPNES
ncbi:GtrA family protein [Roseibium algae]|uniref:GtrA family protein n=1 Tax=Roseibium algae TaxID=3123038 RepID=A0ABU8TNM9_9HYPH